ncbi:MAG: phosphate/phosphite/phosphonate ABC transporter substrate-binding protein [Candidatus Zixiibacteriota bacterium]
MTFKFSGKTTFRYYLSMLIMGLILVMMGCGEKLQTVDMNDRVQADDSVSSHPDTRPALRVAIGAMISPETTRDYYEELIELLADKLGRRAIFSQRRTYAEVNALVANKEADIAFVCSGPYTKGHDEFGMEIIAAPVVRGQTVYHSYILAHRDSEIQSFDDLRGKRFAFTDPNSNTGFLAPTYMLSKHGKIPESFFGETFYTHSHDNSIRAVAEGLADGAAVNALVWDFINAIEPELTECTRIVDKSPPYAMPPVVVHPDLPGELKKQLRTPSLHCTKIIRPWRFLNVCKLTDL